MRAELSDEIVTIKIQEDSQRAISLNQKSSFGKLEDDVLELSLVEAFYLMEHGRLKIYQKDKKLEENVIREIIKEKGVYGKYLVYRDLKNRGYIIKTGFKYGSEFRLYKRGKSPGEGHSDFLVKVVYENYDISVLNFSSYVRVAHGVNKSLLLAVVDDDEDITYYEIEWTRP
ncbi:tRNA-splicing endonuclease subunit alpha [Methanobrevibacter cuticularis]|uniref:tRNA-splicing endonuclease subunit alpha n=1 Tax=Methanobrevibacter cuticularis TaxID=47311 RepID=A0A166EYH3_9EURY|nr:tRNA-intron lyase [Methanobrevibacter cuticularis]KZX17143.1 tRNA-splicing endonuclease subunit alpha [Methanobrevibacter cuticularis]